MKKIYYLLFVSILLTGCSKKYVCALNKDDNGILTEEVLTLKYNQETLTKVEQTTTITLSKDYVSALEDTYDAVKSEYRKYKKLDGYTLNTKNIDNQIIVDLKIDLNKTTTTNIHILDTSLEKRELLDDLKDKGYTCK